MTHRACRSLFPTSNISRRRQGLFALDCSSEKVRRMIAAGSIGHGSPSFQAISSLVMSGVASHSIVAKAEAGLCHTCFPVLIWAECRSSVPKSPASLVRVSVHIHLAARSDRKHTKSFSGVVVHTVGRASVWCASLPSWCMVGR
jgi:hypothetical protein